MNYNLPDKKSTQTNNLSLFPQEIHRENIEKQLHQVPASIQKVLNYYLLTESETKYEEIQIFLELYHQMGKMPIEQLHHPVIYKIFKTVRQIKRQIHKLTGLLRFREIEGGYLYAPFTADFDIIVPLSHHFANRFPNERLIIHDIKRNKALFIEKRQMHEITFHENLPPDTSNEQYFQQLWREYHQNISIKQRENKKLQRQNIPYKFQTWLTEFQSRNHPQLSNSDTSKKQLGE